MAELERDFSTVGPLTLNFTADDPAAVAKKIKDFYLGADGKFIKQNFDKITRVIWENVIAAVQKNKLSRCLQMYTDRQFVVPLVYSISTMRAFSTHRSIYLYQFGYKGTHSMSKAFDPNSSTNYGANLFILLFPI